METRKLASKFTNVNFKKDTFLLVNVIEFEQKSIDLFITTFYSVKHSVRRKLSEKPAANGKVAEAARNGYLQRRKRQTG